MKCTPNPGQPGGGTLFMKYSLEFKMECVQKHMKGEYIPTPDKVHVKRRTFLSQVRVWTKNYKDLGIDGLKHSNTNIEWTQEKRFELVAKVLAGNSIKSVAKQAHINDGQLYQWVKKYKEKGMDGLQLRKGRKPKMPRGTKKDSTKLTKSEKEELILLKEKAKYLEMENEYLKKLDALVTKREAAETKAKKQK